MNITIIAISRIRKGADRELIDDYLARANRMSPALGIKQISEIEIEGGPDPASEADKLLQRIPDDAFIVALDEHAKPKTSPDFAKLIALQRDEGIKNFILLIGGADGLTEEVMRKARYSISYGRQTWPHKLVRIMLAEQIYRALSILAGTPYHRGDLR